jgi:hypothetical protein
MKRLHVNRQSRQPFSKRHSIRIPLHELFLNLSPFCHPGQDHGGYGVLSFSAGTSTDARVEWVDHEVSAMGHHCMNRDGGK